MGNNLSEIIRNNQSETQNNIDTESFEEKLKKIKYNIIIEQNIIKEKCYKELIDIYFNDDNQSTLNVKRIILKYANEGHDEVEIGFDIKYFIYDIKSKIIKKCIIREEINLFLDTMYKINKLDKCIKYDMYRSYFKPNLSSTAADKYFYVCFTF